MNQPFYYHIYPKINSVIYGYIVLTRSESKKLGPSAESISLNSADKKICLKVLVVLSF